MSWERVRLRTYRMNLKARKVYLGLNNIINLIPRMDRFKVLKCLAQDL